MAEKKYPLSLIVRAVDKATGPLRAITARLKRFTGPINEAGKNLRSSFKDFSETVGLGTLAKGFQGVGGAVSNVGREAFALGARLFAVAGAASFALFTIVRGAVDAGDKMSELSARTGVAVNWIASMRYAAAQLGDVTEESFNSGIVKFTKNLGDMKAGGGTLLSFLHKVSPALAKQVKGAKNTSDAFGLMTDAFKRLDDPQKRAALGAAVFGRASGGAMAEFLHQGRGAIMDQVGAYFRLSGSQEDFAKGASELDNALRDTETAFLGLRSAAGGALFPAFTKLSKAVTDFIVKNRDGIAQWAERAAKAITAWVDGGGIDRLVSTIGDVITTAREFIEVIGGFRTVAIAVAAVMAGPLLGAIAMVIPAVVSLGVALLTTPVGWFLLAIGAIAGAAYLIYKNWEPIKKFFADLWDDIVGRYVQALDKIKEGFRWLKANVLSGPFGVSQDSDPSLLPVDHPARRRLLPGGAEAARPTSASTDASVRVSFDNVPPGTRVSTDRSSTQPVDMSLNYSMVN